MAQPVCYRGPPKVLPKAPDKYHDKDRQGAKIAGFNRPLYRHPKLEPVHSPKNLAMALSVEASELVEIFQWMSQEQSYRPDRRTTERIAGEIGDIMIYLSMIADCFELDPISAAEAKLADNHIRFPEPPAPDDDRGPGRD